METFVITTMHMLLNESRLSEEVLSSITNSNVFGLLIITPLQGSNNIPSIPVNLDSDAEHSVQDINSPEKNAPPIQKPKKIFYFAQRGCKLAVTLGGTFLADVHVILLNEQ
ncbi:hypothetical protein ACJX0J_029635, partial [Zea mays]